MGIRKYRPEDKVELMAILKMNVPKYFHVSEIADFEKYLDNELEDYFVVELEGKLVACGGLNFFPKEKQVRISWDIVHPEYHGEGIGKSLVQYRIKWAQKKQPEYQVIVRTSQLSFGFYRKMGFEIQKIIKDYWDEGFDLYQLNYQQ